jgi:hypothetical protein
MTSGIVVGPFSITNVELERSVTDPLSPGRTPPTGNNIEPGSMSAIVEGEAVGASFREDVREERKEEMMLDEMGMPEKVGDATVSGSGTMIEIEDVLEAPAE